MLVRTRLLALTAAIAPLAALGIVGAAPASAQPGSNCGSYPPGQAYGMRANVSGTIATRVTQRRIGDSVALSARVFRGGENCSGRSVRFYVHGPREFNSDGSSRYHLTGTSTTDANGIAIVTRTVINSFRWYAEYSSDNGTGVATSRGADRLIQAVR